MKKKLGPSEFKHLKNIEYFKFEEDFIEDNVRCIPMVVRFKLDAVGIKLKLSEWSKFDANERIELALKTILTSAAKKEYYDCLIALIAKYTQHQATLMAIDQQPVWGELSVLPSLLVEKIMAEGMSISLSQWVGLSDIKRFTLLKLCRPGHEHKNFPKAMLEFGLID